MLAGLAPLWQAVRTAPNAVLSEGVRASAAAPAQRLSKAFLVAEIALAFTLLSTSIILVTVSSRGSAATMLDAMRTAANPRPTPTALATDNASTAS